MIVASVYKKGRKYHFNREALISTSFRTYLVTELLILDNLKLEEKSHNTRCASIHSPQLNNSVVSTSQQKDALAGNFNISTNQICEVCCCRLSHVAFLHFNIAYSTTPNNKYGPCRVSELAQKKSLYGLCHASNGLYSKPEVPSVQFVFPIQFHMQLNDEEELE